MKEDDNIWLGICNFLSYKTGIDAWLFRCLFIIFLGNGSLLVYLLCYLCMYKDIENAIEESRK